MQSKRNSIFGTDGIRAKYGIFPIDESSIIKLGMTVGKLYNNKKILIGRDTRESGEKIESLLLKEISKYTDVKTDRITPTPVLSFLVGKGDFDLGIMITASHNPYHDNGIKFFSNTGEKLSELKELEIEERFFKMELIDKPKSDTGFNINDFYFDRGDAYQNYIESIVKGSNLLLENKNAKKLKLVIDCSNGAFYNEAEKVFDALNYNNIVFINNIPNGKNINMKCGSTNPKSLIERVKKEDADLGFAFDGDGDRIIAVDKKGNILDGDYIMFLIAKYLKNSMDKNLVIGTIMANLGFEKALGRLGINLIRTDVGDKYVYRELKKSRAILGGEKSGHIIIGDFKTGDGLIAMLYYISAINYFNIPTEEITGMIKLYPQVLLNFTVKEKKPIDTWKEMNDAIKNFNKEYGHDSRIIIRYSGTEPKLRIMIESEDKNIIEKNKEIFKGIILRSK